MKNNKVLIIEPRGVKVNIFRRFLNYPLLGPLYLGAILERAGFDVTIYNENILKRDLTLHEMEADYLLLSLLTPTAERGYELARMFRASNPGGRIVIGGIHPTMMKEEAAEVADHVAVGEGENIVEDLLRYGSEEKYIYGTPVENMDDLPFPAFHLIAGKNKSKTTPVMTSRGCPYDCSFCAVTKMFGRRYRRTSNERIIEELDRVKTKRVFFYDDHFTANVAKTHDLLERMIDRKYRFGWSVQVRADITRDGKLIAKMRRAGCTNVFVGFESVNQATLDSYNKGQTIDEIRRAIRVFHQNGIFIHGMFVVGDDHDTCSTFTNTLRFSLRNMLSSVQFTILTPFPGTPVFEKLKSQGRLLHTLWNYYDGQHVVFKPKNLSPAELQEDMLSALKHFYSYLNATKDALNIVVELGGRTFGNLRARIRLPQFGINIALKLIGKSIVKKWEVLNRDYITYLRKLSSQK